MQVIVDGLLINYDRAGHGPVIVLLHGWGDQAKGLHALQAALAKRFDVIALDLPGFGGSERPPEAWGLDEYAGFVAAFLKKIHAAEVHGFIGHSNGGAIVIRGLANGTLQAERLVLLASAGIRGEHHGRMKAVRYATKAGKMLASPLPTSVKHSLRRKVYQAVGSDMLVAEHMQATFKKVVSDDVREAARHIVQPTLLIYGEADEQTPVAYGELLHQMIDGSTLEILPGAGHFVHLDRPHQVVQSIQDFLS